MRVPEPDPVFSFLRATVADAAGARIAAAAPSAGALCVAGPYIPSAARFRLVPQAEPVMAGVWPHVADIPFEPILGATPVWLPQIAALSTAPIQAQVPAASRPAASLA